MHSLHSSTRRNRLMTQQLTRLGATGATAGSAAPRRSPLALGLILTVQLMILLDATVVNVALPHVQIDLGFTPTGLSWVLNAYTLAFGGLLLLGGRIGDVFGRRRTFTAGLALFTVASLLGGLAQSAEWLIAARTLQGVGAAIAAPSVLALITAGAENVAARNRALALFSAVSSAGASLGLILGGLLTGYASWRWSLFINVPIGAVVLVLVPRFVVETPRRPGRFDIVGALTATLGSTLLVYGFISAPDRGWSDPVTIGSFVLAAILIATFVRTEQRIRHPLLDLVLLRNRRRVGGILTMALMVGSQFAFFFFTVQFMQHVLGYGALRSGLAYLPLSLLIFVVSRFAANLTARFGIRPLIITGVSLLLIANLWMTQLSTTSTYIDGLLAPMLLIGIGAGLSFMPLTVSILSDVAPEHAGSASGVVQMSQQVGGSIGLAVLVTVYASHAEPARVVPGMPASFLAASGFLVLALASAIVLIRSRATAVG
jgi:EmrB/QacA subfamily drug resistance transporter